MGKVWSVDAVAKNASTSFYGNLVALAESPRRAGLIYAGTDDGLIQVTEDGGKNWRKVESFPGVPEHDLRRRHRRVAPRRGRRLRDVQQPQDGRLQALRAASPDRGRSWTSIAGDLPARGSVYTFAEDPVNPDLLFVGTEFGVFFTLDGGTKWVQLKGGLPTIAVRDLAIQKRENDLVLGTFGRGFYVLDDYTPLRSRRPSCSRRRRSSSRSATRGSSSRRCRRPPGEGVPRRGLLRRPEPALRRGLHVLPEGRDQDPEEDAPGVVRGAGEEGGGHPLPVVGRAPRRDARARADGHPDGHRRGRQRRAPTHGPAKAGFHRVAWDLRYPAVQPDGSEGAGGDPVGPGPRGPLVAPGTYRVSSRRG